MFAISLFYFMVVDLSRRLSTLNPPPDFRIFPQTIIGSEFFRLAPFSNEQLVRTVFDCLRRPKPFLLIP
jgi:hypothetical protein